MYTIFNYKLKFLLIASQRTVKVSQAKDIINVSFSIKNKSEGIDLVALNLSSKYSLAKAKFQSKKILFD